MSGASKNDFWTRKIVHMGHYIFHIQFYDRVLNHPTDLVMDEQFTWWWWWVVYSLHTNLCEVSRQSAVEAPSKLLHASMSNMFSSSIPTVQMEWIGRCTRNNELCGQFVEHRKIRWICFSFSICEYRLHGAFSIRRYKVEVDQDVSFEKVHQQHGT